MMQLSNRLSAILAFVPKAKVVADIGCDHGFVSIRLIQDGIAERVLASDVNEGPLLRAKEHVKQYGLSNFIQLRLSDGMHAITSQDEVETAVIAGMGGKLMVRILSDALKNGLAISNLVLQPQSEWEALRSFLRKHGYQITNENMIYEDGKYYPILLCSFIKQDANSIIEEECLQEGLQERTCAPSGPDAFSHKRKIVLEDMFGPILLQQCHPVLCQYLKKELDKFMPILSSLPKTHKSYGEIEKKVDCLCAALERMGG